MEKRKWRDVIESVILHALYSGCWIIAPLIILAIILIIVVLVGGR